MATLRNRLAKAIPWVIMTVIAFYGAAQCHWQRKAVDQRDTIIERQDVVIERQEVMIENQKAMLENQSKFSEHRVDH